MKHFISSLVFCCTLIPFGHQPAACDVGSVHRLTIDPISPDRRDIFAGEGKSVRVEFHNYSDSDPVTAFPEPPLTVRRLATNASCEIDGGIWPRDSVFLSDDEKILVVAAFSGSSAQLLAYDTGTCKVQGKLDVSNARLSVSGKEITLATRCSGNDIKSCKNRRVIPASKLCN
jgi:hypothetical protein